MFHTYMAELTSFQEWLRTTDQMQYTKFLDYGGRKEDYPTLQIEGQPQDQYLLYVDDEAGLCGSAALSAMPYDADINNQFIPQGTWILRNVFFYISQTHELREQPMKIQRIFERFQLGLFEQLWHAAQHAGHQVALSLQGDIEAHKDLESLGGFTFRSVSIEEDDDICLALGVMLLTPETYAQYQHTVQDFQQAYASHSQDPQEVCLSLLLTNTDHSKGKRTS